MILRFISRTFTHTQTRDNLTALQPFNLSISSHFLSQSQAILFDPKSNCIDFESNCISQADPLFDKIRKRDILEYDYNHLLFLYSRENRNVEALKYFVGIRLSRLPADGSCFSCVLKVCGCLLYPIMGQQMHCTCIKSGFEVDVSVGTSLVDMYMKTKNINDGSKVFDGMTTKSVVSWTSLIAGYKQNGLVEQAWKHFFQMLTEGIKPNGLTFSTVFGSLASADMVEKGIQLHALVIKTGLESTTSVGNSLVNMYSKWGMINCAIAVFDDMEIKNAVSWNGMIAGFVTNGLDLKALKLFYYMRIQGIQLTQMTFGTVIRLCGNLKELGFSKQLHCRILKDGFIFEHDIRTGLMVAYNKCGEMDDAFKLFTTMKGFQNIISWTAMISGYLQNGGKQKAVDLFRQMGREGICPNDFTYSTLLTAIPFISPFQIHAQVVKTNLENFPSVGTALLDAYVKIGNSFEAASKVFERIDEKDIVAWSAMLGGYAQIGDTEEALKVFLQLAKEGFSPNEFTFCSVINASAGPVASVEQGKQLHATSIKYGFSRSLCVSSALVTMYAKRGNIESANEVFERQRERDLVSWNSMISGYAQHGFGRKALTIFEEMRRRKMEMDGVTFIGVISACTHAGLVNEGENYFEMMVKDYHIYPKMEHYSCMVDLYSRAGMLEKAKTLINKMPYEADGNIWRTLLSACRFHLNLELGKLAGEKLMLLDPHDSATYVLLSNIYAVAGNWQERARVRKLMRERKVKKEAGYSWIDVKNKTHSFLAGDISHPLSSKIYEKLEVLHTKAKDEGYEPDSSYVLQHVEEEQKEVILSQHSERLAIAFGLIATVSGSSIQIVKNLRICGDCHTFIKLTSKIEGREIVVRDSNRFHHFKDGFCSCGDYW